MKYVLNRAKEASTWAGIAGVLVAGSSAAAPEVATWMQMAAVAAGAIAAALPGGRAGTP